MQETRSGGALMLRRRHRLSSAAAAAASVMVVVVKQRRRRRPSMPHLTHATHTANYLSVVCVCLISARHLLRRQQLHCRTAISLSVLTRGWRNELAIERSRFDSLSGTAA